MVRYIISDRGIMLPLDRHVAYGSPSVRSRLVGLIDQTVPTSLPSKAPDHVVIR